MCFHHRCAFAAILATLLIAAPGCEEDPSTAGSSAGSSSRDDQNPALHRYNDGPDGAGSDARFTSEQTARDSQPATVRNQLAYPTGDRRSSVVMLEADAPQEVRVGQPYRYTLRVTNLTDTPLHGVAVRDFGERGTPRTPTTRAVAASADDSSTGGTDDARTASARSASDRSAVGADHHATDASSLPAAPMWNVGTLAPKQTVTREFTTTADEVGTASNCLNVSYEPTLCVAVSVVKPQVRFSKQGPSEALICEPLTWTYNVSNTGTGTAQEVLIEDQLPEGLTTADGQRAVVANVGDLPQGQSKRITVQLRAQRPGQYASRATAHSNAGDVHSAEVSTKVRQPVLAVSVQAPQSRFVDEAIEYQVNVQNTGDAPAQRAVVTLDGGGAAQQLGRRDIGTINPGETKSFAINGRAQRGMNSATIRATAQAQCAQPASSEARVEVKTIPALRMECVDQLDPVRVGNNTVYTITVKNQGSGPDSNVVVSADLPAELQFVRGGGATAVRAEAQHLVFDSVSSLGAGETATWTVEVKAQRPADVRFNVQMKSDSLGEQAATETEPTRLIE